MKLEAFKKFVRNNPYLIDYVRNNKMTWQQFYEIYDLYGAEDSIWNNFRNKEDNISNPTIKDILSLIKGIDLKTVQKALTSINKAIDVFKNFNNKEDNTIYEERPKYKYFED